MRMDKWKIFQEYVNESHWSNGERYIMFFIRDKKHIVNRMVTGHGLDELIEEMMTYEPIPLDQISISN